VPGGLPPSAYKHTAWWSNTSSHVQAQAGCPQGGERRTWDLRTRRVTFYSHDRPQRRGGRAPRFLSRSPLTMAVRDLECVLDGSTGEAAAVEVAAAGIDASLFAAAIATRRQLGRLNDLIHAAAIGLVLPQLLEPGEVVQGRPSLAAGNDPKRPYDLQTNRRRC